MANDWGHVHRKIKGKKQEYKNSDMIFFPPRKYLRFWSEAADFAVCHLYAFSPSLISKTFH